MKLIRRLGAGLLLMVAFGSGDAAAEVKAISRANCLGFVNESITYDRPNSEAFKALRPADTSHWAPSSHSMCLARQTMVASLGGSGQVINPIRNECSCVGTTPGYSTG